jgi:hypothetical protein
MSTAGQQLFDQIAAGLWSVLERYRSQAAAVLAGLGPEPGFAGTVLDGHLLQVLRPDDIAAGDAGVAALIHGFLQVLPAAGESPNATLHGFDPGAGQPRGLALVIVVPAPSATFVVALTGAGPTGLALEISSTGAVALGPATLPLGDGWSLVLTGNAGGGGRLQFPRAGTASVLDGQTPVSITLTLQYAGTPIELGPDAGPHVTLSNFSVGMGTGVGADGNPKVAWSIGLPQAELSLFADVVSALVGNTLVLPFDLDLAADPELGFSVKGGGVRATLPANVNLPGVNISAVDLEVSAPGNDIAFSFGISFTAALPGFPLISLTATGLGASFPLSTGTAALGLSN